MSKMLVAPIEALTDPRLSFQERAVLLALYSFKGKTDTVYPSLDAIAERAHITDIPRISKLTKSLSEKGWLTKKKRGFTGCNSYSLTVPKLDESTNLVKNTKKAESTKMVSDTNTNLVKNTKSNLVKNTKYKEQTIEQTIEQTRERDKPSPISAEKFEMHNNWKPDQMFSGQCRMAGIDFEKIPIDRGKQILAEFMGYWISASTKREHTHREWQHKLLKGFIRENQKGDLYDEKRNGRDQKYRLSAVERVNENLKRKSEERRRMLESGELILNKDGALVSAHDGPVLS